MMNIEPLEAAAKALAARKGESILARAGIILGHMKHAVETIVGKEVEVLKRTSKSTGTERLSFVMGKTGVGPVRNMHPERLGEEIALLEKSGRVVDHLKAQGLDVEHVMKGSGEPGYNTHLVDVILNDNVLKYVPGRHTANLGSGKGAAPGKRPM